MVPRVEAPRHAIPVNTRAADALPWQKRSQLPHGKRRLRRLVAECQRLLRHVLHEFMTHGKAQLVVFGGLQKIRVRVTRAAALQRENFKTG